MSENLETSKVRDFVMIHFKDGRGIDVGCSRDPLTADCVAFDRSDYPEVTHRGDIRKLPFKDGEFDWLWSSHALEDLEDTAGALKEWLRVVRPGGAIGLYVPHPELYAKYGSGNTDHKFPGFTPERMKELLEAQNCKIIESWVDDDSDKYCPRYSTLVIARKDGVRV